jgi:hypothetical protein
VEDQNKPSISLRFEYQDIYLQYKAIQKYIEELDESSQECEHAKRIMTELYRVIIHHKFHHFRQNPE